jgi:NAD-dependent deacetylase
VPIEGWEQKYDTRHADGSLLRPFVVFFGESVPMLDRAIEITRTADMMIVVGTSLKVYPAASLVHYLRAGTPIYIIDPSTPDTALQNLHVIPKPASVGVPELVEKLMEL